MSSLLAAFSLLVGTLAASEVPFFRVQTVGGDFSGDTFANDLNDSGDVVGTAEISNEDGVLITMWPFAFRRGEFAVIGAESGIGQSGSGEAISSSGLVAGRYVDSAKVLPFDYQQSRGYYGAGVFFPDGDILSRPVEVQDFTGYSGGLFQYHIEGFVTPTKLRGLLVRASYGQFYTYDFNTNVRRVYSDGGFVHRSGTFNGAKIEFAADGSLLVDGVGYHLGDLVDPAAGFALGGKTQVNASAQICCTGQDAGGRHRALLLTPTAWPENVSLPKPIATSTPPPDPTPTPPATPTPPDSTPTPPETSAIPSAPPSYQLSNGRSHGVFRTTAASYVISGKSQGCDTIKVRWSGRSGQVDVQPNGNWKIRLSGLHLGQTRINLVAINRPSGKHSKMGAVFVIRR